MDRKRERIKDGKLIKDTMRRKGEVDEKHMLIHRDNPEERGRAASHLVIGAEDEAQSGQQMALIAWKVLGRGECGRLRQGSLSPLSASHGTSTPPFHHHPYLLLLIW